MNDFISRDKHINEKSGHDATYYLVFQRYLIVYQCIITVISSSVILPINLNGKEREKILDFFNLIMHSITGFLIFSDGLSAYDSTTILNVTPE
jgi:hypothetical protein